MQNNQDGSLLPGCLQVGEEEVHLEVYYRPWEGNLEERIGSAFGAIGHLGSRGRRNLGRVEGLVGDRSLLDRLGEEDQREDRSRLGRLEEEGQREGRSCCDGMVVVGLQEACTHQDLEGSQSRQEEVVQMEGHSLQEVAVE